MKTLGNWFNQIHTPTQQVFIVATAIFALAMLLFGIAGFIHYQL